MHKGNRRAPRTRTRGLIDHSTAHGLDLLQGLGSVGPAVANVVQTFAFVGQVLGHR